jgi:hypothetical protein
MALDDILITPTTDLFIAALWSAPKNEPILRSLLNAVMTDIGQPAIFALQGRNVYNPRRKPGDSDIPDPLAPTGRYSSDSVTPRWG